MTESIEVSAETTVREILEALYDVQYPTEFPYFPPDNETRVVLQDKVAGFMDEGIGSFTPIELELLLITHIAVKLMEYSDQFQEVAVN